MTLRLLVFSDGFRVLHPKAKQPGLLRAAADGCLEVTINSSGLANRMFSSARRRLVKENLSENIQFNNLSSKLAVSMGALIDFVGGQVNGIVFEIKSMSRY